jgi:tungstate transport system ATP-binding protein
MNDSLFNFTHITKTFARGKQAKPILNNTQIRINKGECVLLSGKNGSGKSTLLRILAGLVKPENTTVSSQFHAQQQQALSWKQARKLLRRHIMYLYQEPYMFDGPVYRNLSYALDNRQNKQLTHTKIKQALAWAKLEEREQTQAKCLSGGEKQRLALAQAWLKQPTVLLLDEPSANMDQHAKRRTGELLAEFKASGSALLIATHDLDHLLPIMDRRLILQNGKLINA